MEFKIGDKVTTRWKGENHKFVRTVTRVIDAMECESGIILRVDNGEKCKCCGHSPARTIGTNLDSNWFKKV